MPDLPLLDSPALFLDAASPKLCVGLRRADGCDVDWRESNDEAGVGLFRTTEDLLRAAGAAMADIRTVIFCEGPGSLLGIRIVAMAVRTWMAIPRAQPMRVLAYRSLTLIAADLLGGGAAPPFHVCSDARRETWNVLTVSADGAFGDVRRCRASELPADGAARFFPESFPHWQPFPADARRVPYCPRLLPALAARFALLRETTEPDAFMPEMPTYRTWSPS